MNRSKVAAWMLATERLVEQPLRVKTRTSPPCPHVRSRQLLTSWPPSSPPRSNLPGSIFFAIAIARVRRSSWSTMARICAAAPGPQGRTVEAAQGNQAGIVHLRHLFQLSLRSRSTAMLAGFRTLIQAEYRPERYGASMRLETMPSAPSLHVCSNTSAPSAAAMCSLRRMPPLAPRSSPASAPLRARKGSRLSVNQRRSGTPAEFTPVL